MPRAAETILEAGLSYHAGWENRLTAILATVLDQHHGFASALFERVGLPTGQRYEAYTEQWVSRTRRVDMQVVAKDEKGGVVAQIWSEHKRWGGSFSTSQREDYLAALDRELAGLGRDSRFGRLLTIVADVRSEDDGSDGALSAIRQHDDDPSRRVGEPSREEPRWWPLTWQLVAEIAYGAGKVAADPWGGDDWLEKAVEPGAPAQQRGLCELIWYLADEEGYAVVNPLTTTHVATLRHAADAYATIEALLSRAADQMRPLTPDGEPERDEDGRGYWQDFAVPVGCWIERVSGAIELAMWDDDGWVDEPQGVPVVAAGVSLEPEWYLPLSKNIEWVHRVRDAEFCFVEYEDWVCCYATMQLSQVAEHGGSEVAGQARFVAEWARSWLQRLMSADFDPGAIEPMGKLRTGRVGRQAAAGTSDDV